MDDVYRKCKVDYQLTSTWLRAEWNIHVKEESGTSFFAHKGNRNLTLSIGFNYLSSLCSEGVHGRVIK